MNQIKRFAIGIVTLVLLFTSVITVLNALNYASLVKNGFVGACAVITLAAIVCGGAYLVKTKLFPEN